jgi:hypothetical protein
MKNKLIVNLILLALIITACGGQAPQTQPKPAAPTQAVTQSTPPPAPANNTTQAPAVAGASFSKDVMPILTNSCINCHGGEQMKAGLDLSSYSGLTAGSFNGSVIVAGNSADSFLVQQVVNGKMPKRGSKLTAAQIQVIRNWIDAGALNN